MSEQEPKYEAGQPAVYRAINAVQAELAKVGIAKSRTNTQGQGFKFRGIDDVYNALAPALVSAGLCVLPRMIKRDCAERTSKSGGALFYVTIEAEFDFVAVKDGSRHTCRTFGEAMDSSDKATNKAMTAAYKYAAIQAFCIPIEGEEDGDSATPESKPAGAPKDAVEPEFITVEMVSQLAKLVAPLTPGNQAAFFGWTKKNWRAEELATVPFRRVKEAEIALTQKKIQQDKADV